MMKTQRKGMRAEELARQWLESRGLVFMERNFNARVGELDLVMGDGDTTVFIEVRFRANPHFGGPLASVTPAKQLKLLRTAALYIQLRGLQNQSARIDIMAISGDLAAPEYQWVKNAIET